MFPQVFTLTEAVLNRTSIFPVSEQSFQLQQPENDYNE